MALLSITVSNQQLLLHHNATNAQTALTGNGTVSTWLSGDYFKHGRLSRLALLLSESSASASTATGRKAAVLHTLQTALVYVHPTVFNHKRTLLTVLV